MSHKHYQPILPCGNKLLQKRWDDAYYQEHQRRLKSARSVVDTKQPARHGHVVQKLKKQQIESERAEQIDRDNLTLLKKMDCIMKKSGAVDHINGYTHHSLNKIKRQRELDRVARENVEMQKRLEKVEPVYRLANWVDDWRKNAELTERITSYPTVEPTQAAAGLKARKTEIKICQDKKVCNSKQKDRIED